MCAHACIFHARVYANLKNRVIIIIIIIIIIITKAENYFWVYIVYSV